MEVGKPVTSDRGGATRLISGTKTEDLSLIMTCALVEKLDGTHLIRNGPTTLSLSSCLSLRPARCVPVAVQQFACFQDWATHFRVRLQQVPGDIGASSRKTGEHNDFGVFHGRVTWGARSLKYVLSNTWTPSPVIVYELLYYLG